MRVAIVHYTAPPVVGGVEQIVGEQASLLARHGCDVVVVAGRGSQSAGSSFRGIPLLAGTHPRQRSLSSALDKGIVPKAFIKTREAITRELVEAFEGVDAVLAHNAMTLHFNVPLTAALADLAAGSLAGRIVAWTHDIAAVNPQYEPEMHLGPPWDMYRRPQPGIRYVTISDTRRQELRDLWRREVSGAIPEVTVIPNGIDPIATLAIPKHLARVLDLPAISMSFPILLCPVRITARKNLELAIETLAELCRRGLDPVLLVTGPVWGHHPARSREYLASLDELASRRDVTDRVHFLARALNRPLSQNEVSALYTMSTVLLLPSRSEGFGLPLLEAGLHRLPIVASDLPVFREIVGDGAWLFPRDARAGRVADLIEEAAPATAFRSRVLRDYSWESIYEQRLRPLLARICGKA